MTSTFDPDGRAVLVGVTLVGPVRTAELTFALDTGATLSTVRPVYLTRIGCDLGRPVRRVRMRSATGTAMVDVYPLSGLSSCRHVRPKFPIGAHELSSGTTVDGLLGLDFFRGLVLTLDFAEGRISLRPPRRWWQFLR